MSSFHVAIIMDGNRRWAKQRRFEVLRGHRQGTNTIKEIARHAYDVGVTHLTAFAFSSENWKRPKIEVAGLIDLMKRFLMQDLETLISDNVKLRIIGDITAFDSDLQALFIEAQAATSQNTGLNLTIAINYGGQQDIAQAMQKAAEQAMKQNETALLQPHDVKPYLQTRDLPSLDLLIRTGGEKRLSNFLLWDCAYAELFFSDKLWPDFTTEDLDQIIREFGERDRRFGGDTMPLLAALEV